jgi:hypothetical protein
MGSTKNRCTGELCVGGVASEGGGRVTSVEREQLNREKIIREIADTTEDWRPARMDEIGLVGLGLFTLFLGVFGCYYLMPPARRVAFDAALISSPQIVFLTLLTYILLLITIVAVAYAMFRRVRILRTAEELEHRLRLPAHLLSDEDLADALVLSWNLTVSGDLESAARLRERLPENLQHYWPVHRWPIRRMRTVTRSFKR